MENISFRPMTTEDLPQLHRWLNNPKVAEWYGLSANGEQVRQPSLEQVVAQYEPRTSGAEPTLSYFILLDGAPIGYIQSYRIGDYPGYAATLDVGENDVGIDLLIGEDEHRDRGLGVSILRRFLADEVFQRPDVERAIIAPNPDNARAVHCYEKAGFRHVKTVFVEQDRMQEYVMALPRTEFEAPA